MIKLRFIHKMGERVITEDAAQDQAEAYFRGITGLVSNHHNKANTAIKRVK